MAELNYRHLRYFHAVAHDGNLTRTAERMNVSQSALSVQIRRLEQHLGHQLFERRGRQLHLTEAGRVVLDHADAIFATGEELVASLRHEGQARPTIRIGMLATLSRNFAIGLLRPLLHLDVDVVLRSGTVSELLRQVETLDLDVILLSQPLLTGLGEGLVSHRLAEQRASLVGTPVLCRFDGSLRDALRSRSLIVPNRESGIRIGLDALLARWKITPRIAVEADDMALLRLLAREGVGLAVIPPIVVKDELASGLLVERDQLHGVTELFYAVMPKRKFPNPVVRLLFEGAPELQIGDSQTSRARA